MALHPQITCRHRSKFSVTPLSIWMPQYSKLIGRFWITQARWQVAGQYCLSRLQNPFIPRVCAFTYLSLSIFFMADTSSSSHPGCSVECRCKSRTWACQYTKIHRAFQGVYRSQESGCDKHGVNDTHIPLFCVWGPLSWSTWGSPQLCVYVYVWPKMPVLYVSGHKPSQKPV